MKSFTFYFFKNFLFLIALFLINFSFAEDISREEKGKLHVAIIEAHDKGNHHLILDLIKDLMKEGGNVNVPDTYGQTTLHIVSALGYKNIAGLLIKNGAEVNVKNIVDSQTPLHYTFLHSKEELAKLLIESGAEVNARDKKGQTPLHYASWFGNIELAKFSLESGAEVNAKNNKGQTPLHYASMKCNQEIAVLLIKSGANESIKDKSGKTAKELADENCINNLIS
ncbi:MAG: ankyrin repeat domain-containing protein [Bdellovibrionales bacterium]|nr:ankyrin repeat domain-containing protein [Bdellovibrionales bacterium]